MSADDLDRRLVDEPGEGEEVRSLLVAGATEEVPYDFERGLAAHLAAVAAPVAAAAGGAAAAKGAAALGGKLWVAIATGSVVAASAIAVALHFTGASPDPSKKAVSDVAKVPVSSPARVDEPVAPPPAAEAEIAESTRGKSTSGSAAETRPAPRASALGVDRTAPTQLRLAESPEVADEVPSSPKTAAHENAFVHENTAVAPTPSSVESSAAIAQREAEEASRQQATRVAQKAESDRVAREMEALVEAKHALRSDPARALELARAGEREFPHGMLVEERQHILILALIQLGRVDEAKRRAAPYLSQHPDSPFSRRVQKALDAAGAR